MNTRNFFERAILRGISNQSCSSTFRLQGYTIDLCHRFLGGLLAGVKTFACLVESRVAPPPANCTRQTLQGFTSIFSTSNYMLGTIDSTRIPLYGRERELERLKENCHRAFEKGTASRCTFLEGSAGCGKTKLIESLQSEIPDALFCKGKFDETQDTPYKAIIDVFYNLVQEIQSSPEKDSIKKYVREHVDQEIAVLGNFVTNFTEFFEHLADNISLPQTARKDKWAFERLRFAAKVFLRAISQKKQVIMVIDDLQWANRDSLEVLRGLIDDAANRNLFVCCVHRPFNDDTSRPVQDFQQSLILQIDKIELQDLPEAALGQVILAYIPGAKGGEDHGQLVSYIFQKTKGHVFFSLQMLKFLFQEGLIQDASYDLSIIEDRTRSIDSMCDVNTALLQSLPDDQKELLSIASCFGASKVEILILCHALCERPKTGFKAVEDFLRHALNQSSMQGFLDLGSDHFTFRHDTIREAARGLMSDKDRKKTHLLLGRRLRDAVESMQLANGDPRFKARMLFNATIQMNYGEELITDKAERGTLLAELNYQAAMAAHDNTSYEKAKQFLEHARERLDNDSWKSNYELSQRVETALTKVSYFSGHFDRSVEIADRVIHHARSFSDKKEALSYKTLCLMQLNRIREAQRLCVDILAELGVNFPRSFANFRAGMELGRLSKILKSKTEKELKRPRQRFQNEGELYRIHSQSLFLMRLVEISYVSDSKSAPMYRTLIPLRMAHLASNYPAFEYTANNYATWALALTHREEFVEASRIKGVVLEMIDECRFDGSRDYRAEIILHLSITQYADSFVDSIQPLKRALKAFWDEGDVESYFLDMIAYIQSCYCAGVQLEQQEEEQRQYANLLRDFSQFQYLDAALPYLQMTTNLSGRSWNGTLLDVSYMKEDDFLARCKKMENAKALVGFYSCKLFLSVIYGNMKLACDMAASMKDTGIDGPVGIQIYRKAYISIANYAMYGLTREIKYERSGFELLKLLQSWSSKGARTCNSLIMIIEGERLASMGSPLSEVATAFASAIKAASELKLVHNEALACERFGVYLGREGQEAMAIEMLRKAQHRYREWGSESKAEQIGEIYFGTETAFLSTHSFSVDPFLSTQELSK